VLPSGSRICLVIDKEVTMVDDLLAQQKPETLRLKLSKDSPKQADGAAAQATASKR
jgi:hypothetical protein